MTKIQKILNTLGLVFITLALTVGCSTIDVQDTRDMEEFERHYKSCDKWVTISSEVWMECMMLRPDTTLVPTMEIHTTTSGNTVTSTYQPITIWSSVGT